MQTYLRLATFGVLLATATACGKGGDAGPGPETPTAASAPKVSNVKATGRVIVVEMYTDEKGNYFKPAKFEVHRGDTIRFTLVSGVHNVNFLADSNPGRTDLPAVSQFLQLPGQTHDVFVTMAPGDYYFQCDPHALLGMVGRIEVEDE